MRVALSQKVQDVCAANYGHMGATCHKCPLRSVCVPGYAIPCTEAALNDYRLKLNAVAELVELPA